MTYAEALAWLYGLQRFGIKLGLENIRRLITDLAVHPNRARVIHIAGTNGKGSVCAMIESICRSAKLRTGLFTSPHLVTFRERIQVNGDMISEKETTEGLAQIRKLVATWDPHPTFFEVVTALALKIFAGARVNVIILETGLGGRLDATNAVQSDVTVITPIDLDHQKWLGHSIEEIASEKAGIIKAKVPVISAAQPGAVEAVLRKRAAECDADIEFVAHADQTHAIGLLGRHQKQNAALAVAAVRKLKCFGQSSSRGAKDAGMIVDETAMTRGLEKVEWPARFQRWDERMVIDGAHNPAAARVLVETWHEVFGEQRAALVLGVLADKDIRAICETLLPIAESFALPRIRTERGASPEEIEGIVRKMAEPALEIKITSTISDALRFARAKSNLILVTGSLHFAGEVLAELRGVPAAFEECAQ